ncbi:N-acetylmannosamine-6-phosphate 2-epimerase, partial [Xanthomonas citri pv. citri]
AEAGADLIGTTLCGYTGERPKTDGPDYEVIEALVKKLDGDRPVIAEGRIHTPDQARRAMDLGAHAVVVGTAITHPTSITGWFRDALR